MKAMCLKKMQRYDDARDAYNQLRVPIKLAENKVLIRNVFGIISLFTMSERQKLTDQLDSLQSLMEFYSPPAQATSIAQWYTPGDGWCSDKVSAVVKLLRNRSFFCRFSQSHLVSIRSLDPTAAFHEVDESQKVPARRDPLL